MYQTLLLIPLFYLNVAFFLLLAWLGSTATWRFVKTKKFGEDIGSWLGILLVGGGVVFFVAPTVAGPERMLPIRGYGLFLLLGILAAFALLLRLSKRHGISTDQIISLCIWAVVSGILGARLFYFIEYHGEMAVFDVNGGLDVVGTLFSFLNIANGGLVVFGSIIGGVLGSLIFMRRKKMPIAVTLDMMAPAVMIGIAFGRIGCLMNGCCFGAVCDAHHGIVFPEHSPAHQHQIVHGETFYDGLKFKTADGKTVISEVQPGSAAEKAGLKSDMVVRSISGMVHGQPQSGQVSSPESAIQILDAFRQANPEEPVRLDVAVRVPLMPSMPSSLFSSFFIPHTPSPVLPVYPTQIYSSVAAALLCLALLGLGHLRFFRDRDGLVFAAFLLLYPLIRFHLEMFRNDEPPVFGTGLTISQVVSMIVFVLGILLTTGILCRGRQHLQVSPPPRDK